MPTPTAPSGGHPDESSPYRSDDPLNAFIEEMILYRQSICHEYAINATHNHCIGCALVMDHMEKNHPEVPYGTREQWEIESAFCMMHERDIIKEFIRQKGSEGVRIG